LAGFLAICAIYSPAAVAQNSSDGDGDEESPPAEDAATEQPPEGDEETPSEEERQRVPPPIPGDTIYFKVGEPMMGVQILRSTPRSFVVETAENVPPLEILRRLVDRVELDNFASFEAKRLQEEKEKSQESVVSGEQLAPELRSKLTAPLGDRLRSFQNEDFVEVLDELARDTQVALDIAEAVRAIPPAQRSWTVENVEGLTFLSLLQERLRPAFPNVRIEFLLDKVILSVQPPIEGQPNSPAEGPAPSPAPNPSPPSLIQ
jgi:hypothetical protein